MVGIDADITCNIQRFLGDIARYRYFPAARAAAWA
jgi:hypothetical protein